MGSSFQNVATALIIALALSGCQGPRSLTTHYYLLTAVAAPASDAPLRETVIGVGPVRVAPFLDRPQIITHRNAGETVVSDDRRWAEPLDRGIQRVLVQNLAGLTGADMRNFPWTRTAVPEYAVRVDILDFNRTASGNALLEASWILEDIKGKRLIYSRKERFMTPVDGADGDYGALARAYSELTHQLAVNIAAQIPPGGK